MIQKGGLRAAKIWAHRPKRDFTWEQEPEVQRPALTAGHLCFVGAVGVWAFKLLQEDGCVDSSHVASTHLRQRDRTWKSDLNKGRVSTQKS